MTGRLAALLSSLACAVMTACSCGWGQAYVSSSDLGTLPWQTHARIWARQRKVEWYVVQAVKDSISGIPVGMDMDCRHCRQALARADIDSVRVVYPRSGGGGDEGAELGIVIGLLLVPLVVIMMSGKPLYN